MATIRVTKTEAQIATDVLSLVLNDPDWQELATATDAEWDALVTLYSKIRGAARSS
jgi:hypothetical protein